MRRTNGWWVVFALPFLACGSGDDGDGDGEGRRFDGPLDAPVAEAIRTVAGPAPYSRDAIETDAEGRVVLRTEVEVLFRPSATLGDLERVLDGIDATVTSAIEGVPAVVVRIPDPGSLTALQALAESVTADPSVWFVRRSEFHTPRVLPQTAGPSGPRPQLMHHLAVGGAAAWNLRSAATATPDVIVADGFGGGPPTALNAELTPEQFGVDGAGPLAPLGFVCMDCAPPPPSPAHWHGYHVSGIIAAAFEGPDTPQGRATGMLPIRSRLSVADSSIESPIAHEYRGLQLARSVPGTSVLNISLGWSCGGLETESCDQRARMEGGAWAHKVRSAGLESRLLIVAAGGNIDNPNITSPTMPNSSMMIAAAVRDDLIGPDDGTIPPLTNTLAVTGVRTVANPGGSDPERVECLADWSFVGGHVSAVGEAVYSIVDGEGARAESGTSMSAPQVAGLAAYVLSVQPALTAPEVRQLLIDTASPVDVVTAQGCSEHPTPAPSIDAYAALLALDVDANTPRLRRALLDFDDDGTLEVGDVTELLSAVEAGDGALDYGRADLNGDGYTGGARTVTFDLNANGDADDLVSVLIDGEPFEYDESSVTDLDLLCYYAHSPLLGSPGAGQSAITQACDPSGSAVMADFPAIVSAGVPAELIVSVVDGTEPLQGAAVSIVAEGTTDAAAAGTTNPAGEYRRLFTATATATEVRLEIVTTAGGVVLDERTVIAAVTPPAVRIVDRTVRGFVRARVLADSTFIDETDEDVEDTPAFTDADVTATRTETAPGDAGGSAMASGTAQSRATHQANAAGEIERIDVLVDAAATVDFTAPASGYAEAFANGELTFTLEIEEPRTLTYDVTLEAMSDEGLASFSIREIDGATRTWVERNSIDGSDGSDSIAGTTELIPGRQYQIIFGIGATPRANGTVSIPSASGRTSGSLSFMPP